MQNWISTTRQRVHKAMVEAASKWLEGQRKIIMLEQILGASRAQVRFLTEENLRLRKYEDGTLKRSLEFWKSRARIVENELGLSDLFAWDVGDEEAREMLRRLKDRKAVVHFAP